MDLKNINVDEVQTTESTAEARFPPIWEELKEPLNKGDKVKVNKKFIHGKENIVDKELIIDKCWLSNLGNMSAYLIKLKQDNGVENPYLAHHFIKL